MSGRGEVWQSAHKGRYTPSNTSCNNSAKVDGLHDNGEFTPEEGIPNEPSENYFTRLLRDKLLSSWRCWWNVVSFIINIMFSHLYIASATQTAVGCWTFEPIWQICYRIFWWNSIGLKNWSILVYLWNVMIEMYVRKTLYDKRLGRLPWRIAVFCFVVWKMGQ